MKIHLPSSSKSGRILWAISEISLDFPENDVSKYIAQRGRNEKKLRKRLIPKEMDDFSYFVIVLCSHFFFTVISSFF